MLSLPAICINSMLMKFHWLCMKGFEGRIIILHKNPYRWRLQNDAKRHGNFLLDDAHAHRKSPVKSVQIAGGELEFSLDSKQNLGDGWLRTNRVQPAVPMVFSVWFSVLFFSIRIYCRGRWEEWRLFRRLPQRNNPSLTSPSLPSLEALRYPKLRIEEFFLFSYFLNECFWHIEIWNEFKVRIFVQQLRKIKAYNSVNI